MKRCQSPKSLVLLIDTSFPPNPNAQLASYERVLANAIANSTTYADAFDTYWNMRQGTYSIRSYAFSVNFRSFITRESGHIEAVYCLVWQPPAGA